MDRSDGVHVTVQSIGEHVQPTHSILEAFIPRNNCIGDLEF
jgi:hypothetical protein